MLCAGCKREIEIGDHYIEDTVSGFMKGDTDSKFDNLVSEILGGSGGKIIYCEECTKEGGDYLFETFYGEESDE